MRLLKNIMSLFFFIPIIAIGQTNTEQINSYIEQIIEQTVSSSEGKTNVETIISDLEFLYLNPINLNTTTAEELDKLWVLNDFQIKSLLDYRKRMRRLVSIYELGYIYGFNEKTIELVTPFIFIGSSKKNEKITLQDISRSLQHEFLLRTIQQNTANKNFSGNKQKYYARYKVWYKNRLKIAMIAEKDAGEDFFNGSNPNGFDFYSGFIQYNGQKTLKTIVLGDYRVRAGQGLLIWPGYSSGKSSQIISVQKRGQGITGNTSADEYGFFRGGAIALGTNNITASVFASYKQLDVSFDSVLNGIKSIRTGGLHRTNTEKKYEKNATEQLFGAKINYDNQHMHWGVNWLNTLYSKPFLPSEKIYKNYNFVGQRFLGLSSDYKLLLQRVQFYGEVAYANNSFAIINGVNLMPHPQFITSLVYRNYTKSYFSPYSNALAENSSITNEEGLYAGIQWNTNWNIALSTYADVFSFPWVKYSTDGASNGKEYLIEGVYKPNFNIKLTLRYKSQEKIRNYSKSETSEMNSLAFYKQNNIRMNLWYMLSEKFYMSTRFEYSQSGYSNKETFSGHLLYQDIRFIPTEKMQFIFRHSWFDITDYNSRIYAYESNARYVYSMPAYYGKGTKTYLVLRYKASKLITVWLRYSHTNHFEEENFDKHEGLIQLMLNF